MPIPTFSAFRNTQENTENTNLFVFSRFYQEINVTSLRFCQRCPFTICLGHKSPKLLVISQPQLKVLSQPKDNNHPKSPKSPPLKPSL